MCIIPTNDQPEPLQPEYQPKAGPRLPENEHQHENGFCAVCVLFLVLVFAFVLGLSLRSGLFHSAFSSARFTVLSTLRRA